MTWMPGTTINNPRADTRLWSHLLAQHIHGMDGEIYAVYRVMPIPKAHQPHGPVYRGM